MNSRQAIDLINWFNEYAFNIPREKLFLSNDSNVNLPESAEQLIFITNNNIMLLQGLQKVNPNVPYHFSMILDPPSHQEDWKLLLW